MKILFVQESDWLKRNMHQQHHLAELMSLRGHEIKVIDYEIMHNIGLWSNRKVFPGISKIYKDAKVTVIRPSIIKIPCLDYLSLLVTHYLEIKRQLKEFKPDVIVGFGILNAYLASRSKVPFVYYWIDVLHELIPLAPLRIIGKMVEVKILKKADKVLAINERLKEYLCEFSYLKSIEALGAGVDFKHFNDSHKGELVRKQYKIKDNDIVLLYVGWLYKFSGLDDVFWQMRIVRSKHPKIKLIVVGDGDAYQSLVSLCRKLGMKNSIFMVGKKPYEEIPDYIGASDICILPAYPEHRVMKNIVPIKMYEYMAMGKPVVATKSLAIMREFSWDCGVVYADTPSDVVYEAIEVVRNNEMESIGKKAKDTVKNCSWGNMVDRFEKILYEVIKERNG